MNKLIYTSLFTEKHEKYTEMYRKCKHEDHKHGTETYKNHNNKSSHEMTVRLGARRPSSPEMKHAKHGTDTYKNHNNKSSHEMTVRLGARRPSSPEMNHAKNGTDTYKNHNNNHTKHSTDNTQALLK